MLLFLALLNAPASQAVDAYSVGAGDSLELTIAGETHLATVQHDGTVSFRSIEVSVEGLSVDRVRGRILAGLDELGVTRDEVTVLVKEHRSQSVFVTGEVRLPGRYYLSGNATVSDVLLRAGGLTSLASGEILVEPALGGERARVVVSREMTAKQHRTALDVPIAHGHVINVLERIPATDSP